MFRKLFKLFRKSAFWILLGLCLWILMREKNDAPSQAPPTRLAPEFDLESSTQRNPTEEHILDRQPPDVEIASQPECVDPDPTRPADFVFVDKSERKIRLFSDEDCLIEYKIALGFSPQGQKTKQGDGKTPTGIYTLDWRNSNSSFHRSIHISYPSAVQKAQARAEGRNPGGHIMIHGQPNGSQWKSKRKIGEDWTFGCISISNDEMDVIWNRVENGTKIEIVE